MNNLVKMLLTLALIAAVLIYSVLNFLAGKITLMYLVVFFAILGIPFINILNILIQELKKK